MVSKRSGKQKNLVDEIFFFLEKCVKLIILKGLTEVLFYTTVLSFFLIRVKRAFSQIPS